MSQSLAGRVIIVAGTATPLMETACNVFGDAGAEVAPMETPDGDAEQTVHDIVNRLGRIDGLYNLIGLSAGLGDESVAESGLDVWDAAYATHLRPTVALCRATLLVMSANQTGGAIVNTSSMAASAGGINHVAYSSMKAAIESLTRFIATQYGAAGIRCNAIAHGPLGAAGFHEGSTVSPRLAALVRQTLVGRLGTYAEAASLACFLVSDAAANITGQIIRCDGGLLAHQPHIADVLR
jgi:NAD(P)-dependent dehydrogenase (short-subunit alcohol dehydrogenase family)